ncbi:MAG TPA: hypothetical protein VFX49_13530 [Chloroflexota bacterium]|nr:hypothetical protein [Chloroflexota bacterium]
MTQQTQQTQQAQQAQQMQQTQEAARATRAAATERRAVVRGARYGRWNGQRAGLFFESWLPDGSATLHVLYGDDARAVLAGAGLSAAAVEALEGQPGEGGAAVGALEGHPCAIAIDGYRVRFLRLTD